MFHLRRTALRLLSSPSSTLIPQSRTFVSIAPSSLRIPRQSAAVAFQRRWATSEAEAKKEVESEEAPISEIQPTPQEEVENAIHSDNATESPASATIESASESAVESTLNSVKETVSNTASRVRQTATNAFSDASTAAGHRGVRDRSEGRDPRTAEPKSTIYIGNLFFDVTENDLVKELARFGTVTRCRLMRDSRGLSKGFGYVDFETVESATKAIQTLNQQLFEGRRLAVQYAAYETKVLETRTDRVNKPLNPPSKTLFIGNMSFEMTDRDLNNLFRNIKNVVDVRVAIDRRTGQPRGFAHADFVDVKSAMEGLKELEGKETYGRKLRLDYSYGPSNSPKNVGS